MEIIFDVPHAYPQPASSREREAVDTALSSALRTIAEGSTRSTRPRLSKGPDKSQVTFQLPGLFTVESDPRTNAIALEALLCCLSEIDENYLECHPDIPALYLSGVRYDRTFVWDSTPALYARQYGDCKTVSCTRAAELKRMGKPAKPVFRWMAGPDGQLHFHILILTEPYAENRDGWEDPSKILGMKTSPDQNPWNPNSGFTRISRTPIYSMGSSRAGFGGEVAPIYRNSRVRVPQITRGH